MSAGIYGVEVGKVFRSGGQRKTRKTGRWFKGNLALEDRRMNRELVFLNLSLNQRPAFTGNERGFSLPQFEFFHSCHRNGGKIFPFRGKVENKLPPELFPERFCHR